MGNLSIDAYQRLDYVGVATNFSIIRQHLGEYWLLPDRSISQRGSDLYLRNPALKAATEAWAELDPHHDRVQLQMSSNNVTLFYYIFSRSDPTGPWKPHHYEVIEYSEEGWIEYERLGPFNGPVNVTSDEYFDQASVVCQTAEPCKSVAKNAAGLGKSLTPDVNFGWGFSDVQIATDPSGLTPPRHSSVNTSLKDQETSSRPLDGSEDATNASSPHNTRPRGSTEQPVPQSKQTPDLFPPTRPPPVQVQSPQLQPPPPDSTLKLILGATAVTALLAALGFGLYSRFHTRAEAMRSQTRERLLALIREKPGINLSEAAEAMGLARNAVQHHVRVLERVQLVRTMTEGRMRTLHPMSAPVSSAPAWLRRNEICLAIVRALQAAPAGLSREEVHRLLAEVPERTRNYHLKRLLAVGVIVQTPAPDGSKRLQAAQGLPDGSAPAGANAA